MKEMKGKIFLAAGCCVLCFAIGLLVGRIGMLKNKEPEVTTAATISGVEVRVNAGNLEWYNGAEWIIYGKVEDLLITDDMTMEELEEYYYPIIAERIHVEESQAESQSVQESEKASEEESVSKATEESIAASEAASIAAEQKKNKPKQTAAATQAYEEYEEDDDDDDDEPAPAPEPEPEPEEDNSGDGEDVEWSPDML